MGSAWSPNKSSHKLIGNLSTHSNNKDYKIWYCCLTLASIRMKSEMREKKWDKSNRWCCGRTQICIKFMTSGENKRTFSQYEMKRPAPTANQNQQQHCSAYLKPDAQICCNVLRMIEKSWIDFRGQQYVVRATAVQPIDINSIFIPNRLKIAIFSSNLLLYKNIPFSISLN